MTTAAIPGSHGTTRPTPTIPAAPADVMAAVAKPLLRFDFTATERREWREGRFGARVEYRSERPVAFANVRSAETEYHERTNTRSLIAPTYSGRNFDDAVIAAAQIADELGRWGHDDRRIRHDVASVAVLQASDGAFYLSTVPHQQLPAKTTDVRALGPWTPPSSATGDTAAQRTPSNDDPVGKVEDIEIQGVAALSPLVRAVVTNDTTYDFRSL